MYLMVRCAVCTKGIPRSPKPYSYWIGSAFRLIFEAQFHYEKPHSKAVL